jgi:hypothetical protein
MATDFLDVHFHPIRVHFRLKTAGFRKGIIWPRAIQPNVFGKARPIILKLSIAGENTSEIIFGQEAIDLL